MKTVREWAGKERVFALSYGDILNLQQAVGVGIGVIYGRLIRGTYNAEDAYETIRLALVGGGMGLVEAKGLMARHWDTQGNLAHVALAASLLTEVMVGVETGPADEAAEDDGRPVKFSEVSQLCRVFHMSPLDLRAMSYADVANLIRGYNAANGKAKLPQLTEEEFAQLVAENHDPRLDEVSADAEG